jgi:hypothetical protein
MEQMSCRRFLIASNRLLGDRMARSVALCVFPAPVKLLSERDYRGVYFELQFRSVGSEKLFVQDERADGLLHSLPENGAVDVVYEQGASTPLRFDGDPAAHRLSDADYDARCERADRDYAYALTLLKKAIEKEGESD